MILLQLYTLLKWTVFRVKLVQVSKTWGYNLSSTGSEQGPFTRSLDMIMKYHFQWKPGNFLPGPMIIFLKITVGMEFRDRNIAYVIRWEISVNMMFVWPCIVKLDKVKNQLDAEHMMFIQCSLAQHVSGINMPISRSKI
jgi:hypothetical protein